MDQRLCHKCKKPGHSWRQCPLNKGSARLAITDGQAQVARGVRAYGLMVTTTSDGWSHTLKHAYACVKAAGASTVDVWAVVDGHAFHAILAVLA